MYGKGFKRSSVQEKMDEPPADTRKGQTDQERAEKELHEEGLPPQPTAFQSQDMPPMEDPHWAVHSPRHSPFQHEGQDAFQCIQDILQAKQSGPMLFHKEFPIQPILQENQVVMRIEHLQELFGSPQMDQKEQYLSELKEVHGEAWKLFADPFLLHIRLKKIVPIPYTEWPNKGRFQIYPYTSFWQGANANSASRARQEGFSWAWVRFKANSFATMNLTDFMEIRMVTQELKHLSRHWRFSHRDITTNGSQEMPPFKTPEWEQMLQHQPSWRHMYLQKEELYKVYTKAPSNIRVDPLFYPTERRWPKGPTPATTDLSLL